MDLTNRSINQIDAEEQRKEIGKRKEDLDKVKKEHKSTMDKLNKITTEYIQANLEKDQCLKELEGIKKTADDLHK